MIDVSIRRRNINSLQSIELSKNCKIGHNLLWLDKVRLQFTRKSSRLDLIKTAFIQYMHDESTYTLQSNNKQCICTNLGNKISLFIPIIQLRVMKPSSLLHIFFFFFSSFFFYLGKALYHGYISSGITKLLHRLIRSSFLASLIGIFQ